ncbi:KINASE-INTERACTING FAMILY PROTEIN [Salix purpurea]|uniref:KINASE-INTERACTING FAMILY PROTEIN n=1 Tax=Salix purpurea TaxID=77065 RepID=A0A9Q0W4R6_SALPP|nr:KINASE-INTERACTING FAMILY PROTEIN [Salix purpurea]
MANKQHSQLGMGGISLFQNTSGGLRTEGVDERVKMLLENFKSEEEMGCGESFAERAEWFYQKRPQLLASLQDLYNGYTTLLDRCSRMEKGKGLGKHHSSPMPATFDDDQDQEDGGGSSSFRFVDWDAESSLSYQQPPTPTQDERNTIPGMDEIVADLVMKNVGNDILADQLGDMEKQQQGQESIWRKVELLKKLLEVLESERIVLLNENVRMGRKMQALMEENKGLSSEAMFMKMKAGELARCVLKMREDHRVCLLTRKIEDLQGQIHGLEIRNRECCQQLLKKEELTEDKISGGGGGKDGGVAFVGCCFQLEKLKLKKKNEEFASNGRWSKWWNKVKNMDVLLSWHG